MRSMGRFPLGTYFFALGIAISILTVLLFVPFSSSLVGRVLLVLLGGCGGMVFSLFLRGPLRRLAKGLHDVGRGNLTARLRVRNPLAEFKKLETLFNDHLVGNLQIILLGMKDILEDNRRVVREFHKVTESSKTNTINMMDRVQKLQRQYKELATRVETMTNLTTDMYQIVREVATQITEQTEAIQQSSASVEQVTSSMNSVSRIALAKQESTQSLIRTSQEGGQRVSAAMTAMSQISKGIEEIRSILHLINDVADRTNLLAMNAAIEATHAGQYGRGFAVVAAEIRKLAESTASHTRKVAATLAGFTEKMGFLEEAAKVAFSTINQLNSEIELFVDAFGEIVRSTQEAAKGGNEMLGGITSLRESAETLRSASESMRDRIGDIHASIKDLKELSRDSYAQMENLGKELDTVKTFEEEISRLGAQSIDRINALSTELKYFQLETSESVGDNGENEYSLAIKEIILNHKRIVVSARALLQGRIRRHNLPDPDHSCPLDRWIMKLKTDERFGRELSDLAKKHEEFHALYSTFFQKGEPSSETKEIYNQLEARWKELILFRELVNRLMLALQNESKT